MLHYVLIKQELLTVEEFASRTRQHPETVRRHIRSGAVAVVRTGRKYLIPESVAQVAPREEVVPNETSDELELEALFATSSNNIKARLAALRAFENREASENEREELDLSGKRGELYGYDERESAQL